MVPLRCDPGGIGGRRQPADAIARDSYSTAFALMSDAETAAVARRHGGLRVYVLLDGGVVRLA